MELTFAKLNGLGNDFVVIDDFSEEVDLAPEAVARICDRHFGVGADGVILVRPPKTAGSVAYMHYINSDGTLAQMCGNGVRCFAKYLVDRGFVSGEPKLLTVDTLAGVRDMSFTLGSDRRMDTACVNMGRPILEPAEVPVVGVEPTVLGEGFGAERAAVRVPLEAGGLSFEFTCVSMGNPHAICFIDDFHKLPAECFVDPAERSLAGLDLDRIGPLFESHPAFPEKTNVEFAQVVADGISMRVFERGCGETLACGTGACATLVAGVLEVRVARRATVHLLGGDLGIEWGEDGFVHMDGPARESFEGTLETDFYCK